MCSGALGTGERVGQFHPLPCSLREYSRHFRNNLWDKDGHWGHGPLGFLHIVGRGRGRRNGPHRVFDLRGEGMYQKMTNIVGRAEARVTYPKGALYYPASGCSWNRPPCSSGEISDAYKASLLQIPTI